MAKDAQGQDVSGAAAVAVAWFDKGIREFGLARGNPIGDFDAAIAASPDFPMAYLAKGWLFALARDPVLAPRSREMARMAAGMAIIRVAGLPLLDDHAGVLNAPVRKQQLPAHCPHAVALRKLKQRLKPILINHRHVVVQ